MRVHRLDLRQPVLGHPIFPNPPLHVLDVDLAPDTFLPPRGVPLHEAALVQPFRHGVDPLPAERRVDRLLGVIDGSPDPTLWILI